MAAAAPAVELEPGRPRAPSSAVERASSRRRPAKGAGEAPAPRRAKEREGRGGREGDRGGREERRRGERKTGEGASAAAGACAAEGASAAAGACAAEAGRGRTGRERGTGRERRKEERERADGGPDFCKGKEVFLCVAVCWRQKFRITVCCAQIRSMECARHKITI